ncbi:MAG: hypothetical protein RRZ84_09375, partial [Romboutsia sp.]
NKQNDGMDPNYIYPRPYIDPMMYINPYAMNGTGQMNPNMNMGYYMTYMNPHMSNPMLGQDPVPESNEYYQYDEEDIEDQEYIGNMMPWMNGMQGQMMPGMMPNMNGMQGQMMPGMNGMVMPGMMPGMMMPGIMPMYPFMPMMPGMEPINIEEFDEEEM